MKGPFRTPKQPWRLDVTDAERPVDADAFLRRLADVLMQIKDEKAQPQTDLLHD